MRMFKEGAVALGLLAVMAGSGAAQTQIEEDNSGVGTTSAEFLLLGAGARGMALGSGFGAIVRDVEALYYNPAGLPLMEGPEASFTMMPYFADTDYVWAGVASPIMNGQFGIGLSIANFGFGDQPVTSEGDPQGESGLQYDVSETVVGLSFAHAFIDRFTGGVTLKYINSSLGQTDASGFGVDVGTNFHTEWNGRPIALSFVIQNLGTTLSYEGAGLNLENVFPEPDGDTPVGAVDPFPAELNAHEFSMPIVFRVGAAYDVLASDANRLTLLGQFNEINNNAASWGFGGEYGWTPVDLPVTAALRGSYDFQPDNDFDGDTSDAMDAAYDTDNSDSLDGLTLGGGLTYSLGDYTAGFDYAWRHFGVLGSRNVFSISLGW